MEHGWFVAYFTYKNNPPLALVILVEHAGSSKIATNVARHFLVAYKKLMN
jgi:cell division protein FtsI/penicillin-binding protein 2